MKTKKNPTQHTPESGVMTVFTSTTHTNMKLSPKGSSRAHAVHKVTSLLLFPFGERLAPERRGRGGGVSTSMNESIKGHWGHSGEVMVHRLLSKKSSLVTRHSGNHRDGVN